MTSDTPRPSDMPRLWGWAALCVGLLAGWGCTSRTAESEGIRLEVSVSHVPGTAPPHASGDERHLQTDAGDSVALSHIYLVLGRAELLPCKQASLWEPLLELLDPVATAHAHGPDSPLALSAPHIVDMMQQDGASFAYGVLRPPPGRYCGVAVTVSPADADAPDLPVDPELTGASLHLDGQLTPADAEYGQRFELRSELSESHDVPFTTAQGEPAVLELGAAQLHGELRLQLHYDHLLAGVEVDGDDPLLQQFLAISNLLKDMRAVVCAGPDC